MPEVHSVIIPKTKPTFSNVMSTLPLKHPSVFIDNINEIRLGEHNTLQTYVLMSMTIYYIGVNMKLISPTRELCSMPRDPKSWNTVKGGYTCWGVL